MKRILFLKFGALGDVLMTTPLLRQTRRAFPDAQIDYCVADPFAMVLRDNPHLDRLLPFDPKIFTKFKAGGLLNLIRQIRTERYDSIFVLDKHLVFAFIALLTGIPERIGFVRDVAAKFFLTRCAPFGERRHDVHTNLDLLNQIATADYSETRMEFVAGACKIDRFLGSVPQLNGTYFACVNSGGENVRESSNVRRLPADKFLELLRILATRRPVVLLGSKGDRDYYESLALPANVINLAGETSISECVQIIARAEKFFTTDCGLMHLAATTEIPICAFFGPTHPERKAPLRDNVEWLWGDETVYDAEYDRRGRIPRHHYFTSFTLANLVFRA
jgi:ADP-heptose:LPS heptosyltransferase